MSVAKPEPKAGDPCPQCDGELKPARVPTDEQRRQVENKESLSTYPPNTDTADKAFVEEHGALHICGGCGYQTRVKADAELEAAGKKKK